MCAFLRPSRKRPSENAWKGIVLKTDKFGNLITNISPKDIPQIFDGSSNAFKITVGKAEVTTLASNYAEGAPGELFAILGSTGFLEISANKGAASRAAGADKGSEVTVTIG